MSYVDPRDLLPVFSLAEVVSGPAPPQPTFGAEDERFYLSPAGEIVPPDITQAFLRGRLATVGRGVFESASEEILVKVVEASHGWSLEAAGVVELATRPYLLNELAFFGANLAAGLKERDLDLAALGYHPCAFSTPPDLSTAAAAACLVPTARLQTLYRRFAAQSGNHAAFFTMLQEAVAQISVAPRSWQEAATLLRRALQWAPLLYAATDNSCGYLRGEATPFSVRSREWARHNEYCPPGRERAGLPAILVDLVFGNEESFVERYLDHVAQVPMVYHLDEQGSEVYGEPLAFDDLPPERRTRANAALALSLCWYDARLTPLPGDGLRVEVRSLDGGGPESTWLGALLVCGALVEEKSGAEADALFAASRVGREGFLAARASLPEQGLGTRFGRGSLSSGSNQHSLRDLLPEFCAIAGRGARRLGVPEEALTPLRQLEKDQLSPNEKHRARYPDLAACQMACRRF